MKHIADIPKHDRPREKLQHKGPKALSDLELIAALLGKGTKGQDVMALASQILKILDNSNGRMNLELLQSIKGVGLAKATVIAAALEFGRRRIRPEGFKISAPAEVLPLVQHYTDRKQEYFLCTSLSGAYEVISTRLVSVGLVDRTQVHPREVFADPIMDRASAIIVAHNHPMNAFTPSQEDIEVTKQLKSAGEIIGIRVMDHIIFNRKGYYSFLERGEIFED
jgi:DNA repair protein RadC